MESTKKNTKALGTLLLIIVMAALMILVSASDASAASKKTIPQTSAKADSRVVNAFTDLGFEVRYDKNLGLAGTFSVGKHAIIMSDRNATNTLHEMGHFVSRLQRGADETSEFVKIYKSEKNKYNGKQASYIKSNSKEYFAQSFAEYTQNPTKLKNSRPKTYKYVQKQVNAIDQQDIDDMNAAYSWAW